MKTKIESLSYIEVPELGIKITSIPYFKGKEYLEITEKVDEERIATYEMLQKIRNIAFENKLKKYPFMEHFWVFVPNPDKISKSNGYVARFCVDPTGAELICDRTPGEGIGGMGVFLYEKLPE